MALNLVSPGVRIREVDLTVGGITAANNQVGAIAGPFQKGPVNVPILIETENDLLNTFGKPISSDAQYEYWLGASSYLSYGGILRVVRCNGTALNNANSTGIGSTAGTTLKIESTEDYNNNHSTDIAWAWAARNPGSWANNLKVCVIDAAADQRIAIGTIGLTNAVGYAVTAAFTTVVAGIGTTTTESGTLKGIITKVNAGSIDVKITAKAGSGSSIFTETSYSEGSVSAFTNDQTIRIIDNSNSFVKIETSIARFIGTVSSGSTSINVSTVPTGLATGQFIVEVSGGNSFIPVNATYVGVGTTTNSIGISTVASGTGTVELAVLGIASSGRTGATASDWYNEQTLGLTNATVYWKNIAPRPRTSQYASERSGRNDELHVVVVDDTGAVTGTAGNILEKYTNVSKALDAKISPSEANYYKDIIANNSQYIFPGLAPTGDKTKFSTVSGVASASNTTWGLEAQGNTFNCIGASIYNLTSGRDYSGPTSGINSSVGGYSVGLSDVISAYRNFTNPAEYKIDFLIGGPSGGASTQESQAKANELIAIADIRKDCVATISPHRSDVVNVANSDTQTNNIVNFFDPLTSSSYAVFDTGYKYVYDRFNNQFRYIACNADVAGLMARTSINQYPWFSPAGANRGALNNAVKLAYNPSQAQRDLLYPKRINPIIFSPGAGIILFGDKTALSYTSAFDRINVRRLFLTLESSIERAARAQLFEFNDTITRANFINIVEPYLRDVKSKRGITDFVVVCDESNNTPDVIDGNQFKADIYIKPARSINFIGLTFVATRTGVSFEEIIGTV